MEAIKPFLQKSLIMVLESKLEEGNQRTILLLTTLVDALSSK
jgi:hypothetical protein